MSEFNLKNVDWDDIGEFLAGSGISPSIKLKSFQNRFFKTIEKYIREEQKAYEDYTQMEESLEELSAPEPLIKLFRHFRKDELEHRNLLMEIERLKEYV